MGNRVEDLEAQVAELQAAVDGLTEELVEAKERISQLERSTEVQEESSPDRNPNAEFVPNESATNGADGEREYHVLYVSGARNLRRFADEIGFSIERKQHRVETHARKEANPNHDTIPRQRAARQLCADLNLPTQSLLSETLDPDNPGREAHESELADIVAAATDRIEAAQETLARVEALAAEPDAQVLVARSVTP